MTVIRPSGVVYAVTGERGSGKSTVCGRTALLARREGLKVAGMITERDGSLEGGARQVVDVRSGERRLFGSRPAALRPESGVARPEGVICTDVPENNAGGFDAHIPAIDPLTPGWVFDPGVFAWGNGVLLRSVPCDLLVIDELGPLELLAGRGWMEALPILRSRDFAAALVVCRPGLLKELGRSLGASPVKVFEVSAQTRDALPAAIIARVQEAVAPV